jgi:hypothetical protein
MPSLRFPAVPRIHARRVARAALTTLLMTAPAAAQCQPSWLPGPGVAGVRGEVRALLPFDPDGPGPALADVVVAGSFDLAGTVLANRIASWRPSTGSWTDLGQGLSGSLATVATDGNGVLYAGGDVIVQGAPCRIAQWDGVAWTAVGGGTNGSVQALTVLPNGILVAGGGFTTAGNTAAQRVAAWNGQSWSPLGSGLPGQVRALGCDQNQNVIAATQSEVWSWDGSSWSQLGGTFGGTIDCLATAGNGEIAVGGAFLAVGGTAATNVARWNGSSWQALGSGVDDRVLGVRWQPDGSLVATGLFRQAGSLPAEGIARWDGTTWSALGTGIPMAAVGNSPLTPAVRTALPLTNGDLLVGGQFTVAGNTTVANLARFDGSSWSAIGSGSNGPVRAMLALPDGDLVAAGSFSAIGPGTAADRIARRTAGIWSPLGTLPNGSITSLAITGTGELLAAGRFDLGGGTSTTLLRRAGTTWAPLGTPPTGFAQVVRVLANGDVLLGGMLQPTASSPWVGLVRWHGGSWSTVPLPAPGIGILGRVNDVRELPNGDLVVAFQAGVLLPQAIVSRWNGAAWSPLGAPFTSSGSSSAAVTALLVTPSGSIVAGGNFIASGSTPLAHIARWDGSAWQPLGAGLGPAGQLFVGVRGITALPNGDLVVGGSFATAGGNPAGSLARWDGASWSNLGNLAPTGLADLLPQWLDSGSLVVGGTFAGLGGVVSAHLAEMAAPCPATANTYGSGCVPWPLVASRPWSGSDWTLSCTGMPNGTMIAELLGLAPAQLPLSSYFGNAGAGCQLLLHADAVEFAIAADGYRAVHTIPPSPTLVGTQFSAQLLLAGAGVVGPALATGSTVALRCTIGEF